MSETPGQYNSDSTPFNQPVSSAEQTTLDFVTAINSFTGKLITSNFVRLWGLLLTAMQSKNTPSFRS
jgi:hypothetical protein